MPKRPKPRNGYLRAGRWKEYRLNEQTRQKLVNIIGENCFAFLKEFEQLVSKYQLRHQLELKAPKPSEVRAALEELHHTANKLYEILNEIDTSSRSSLSVMPSPLAILYREIRLAFRSPRSTPPMYVLSRPERSASSSWEMLTRRRAALTAWPNLALMFESFFIVDISQLDDNVSTDDAYLFLRACSVTSLASDVRNV